jgi:hypothetical protein
MPVEASSPSVMYSTANACVRFVQSSLKAGIYEGLHFYEMVRA